MKVVAQYLFENPTASQKAIADAKSLTEDQVRNCIRDLRRDEHISDGCKVSLKYLGFSETYRVDIHVSPSKLRGGKGGLLGHDGVDSQKALARYILRRLPNEAEFKGTVLVEDVKILLGNPADLSATVHAVSTTAMLKFVTEGLRMCEAVYQTSTSSEAWSSKDGDL
jgi:DNA-binding Lrp family transcriptional regulator